MRPSSTTGRRAATALATLALAGLVTATPAFARTDPGPGVQHRDGSSRADGSQLQNDPFAPSSDTRVYQSTIERQNAEQMRNRATTATPGPAVVTFIDDDAVEYLQIGLGALGGIALMGAAAATVSANHRRHAAHPA